MAQARPVILAAGGVALGFMLGVFLTQYQVSAARAITDLAILQMHEQQKDLVACHLPPPAKPQPRRWKASE